MDIDNCIWLPTVVDKLADKHSLTTDEVEEVFCNSPRVFRAEKGTRPGEDLYVAYGQTFAGRYLVIFFILKERMAALVISARDMTDAERKRYGRK